MSPRFSVYALLVAAPGFLCGATAYIVAPNANLGTITEFHPATGVFGAPKFVPQGGGSLAVDPATGQIWQATFDFNCVVDCAPPYLIYVLDPNSGSTLATVTLPNNGYATSIVMDAAGRYAYAPFSNVPYEGAGLVKIDVQSRTIVGSAAVGNAFIALSEDGTKLFAVPSLGAQIQVYDTQSMQLLGTISEMGLPTRRWYLAIPSSRLQTTLRVTIL